MKHLPKPSHPRLSLCGLPYAPRYRPDGTRREVNWPEISNVSTCKSCNAISNAAIKRGKQ